MISNTNGPYETRTANVLKGSCAHECRRTWAVEHGAGVAGGPFPGTLGSAGDVRRCPHGRVWLWESSTRPGTFDLWRQVSRFWEPRLYRRAVRLLARDRCVSDVEGGE